MPDVEFAQHQGQCPGMSVSFQPGGRGGLRAAAHQLALLMIPSRDPGSPPTRVAAGHGSCLILHHQLEGKLGCDEWIVPIGLEERDIVLNRGCCDETINGVPDRDALLP